MRMQNLTIRQHALNLDSPTRDQHARCVDCDLNDLVAAACSRFLGVNACTAATAKVAAIGRTQCPRQLWAYKFNSTLL